MKRLMKQRLAGAALALFCYAAPALAQNQPEVNCAVDDSQMALNICSYQAWQEADRELNATYKKVVALMKVWDRDLLPEDRGAEEALRKSQRAWVAFRDAECALAGFQMRGGTAEALMVNSCLESLTRVRTADLKDIAAMGDR